MAEKRDPGKEWADEQQAKLDAQIKRGNERINEGAKHLQQQWKERKQAKQQAKERAKRSERERPTERRASDHGRWLDERTGQEPQPERAQTAGGAQERAGHVRPQGLGRDLGAGALDAADTEPEPPPRSRTPVERERNAINCLTDAKHSAGSVEALRSNAKEQDFDVRPVPDRSGNIKDYTIEDLRSGKTWRASKLDSPELTAESIATDLRRNADHQRDLSYRQGEPAPLYEPIHDKGAVRPGAGGIQRTGASERQQPAVNPRERPPSSRDQERKEREDDGYGY